MIFRQPATYFKRSGVSTHYSACAGCKGGDDEIFLPEISDQIFQPLVVWGTVGDVAADQTVPGAGEHDPGTGFPDDVGKLLYHIFVDVFNPTLHVETVILLSRIK